MFNRFMNNRMDTDYVGNLVSSFVGALGEVALLSQQKNLSTAELAAATLALTGLNYLLGKAADKLLRKVAGTSASTVTFPGSLHCLHMGNKRHTGLIVADDRTTNFTTTFKPQ